ncbi:MAG: ATPase [Flaviaesturariibacter sp.]|nr:ATPase [Flaviaesturariibacter sp.]
MDNLNTQKAIDARTVFNGYFLESKALYVHYFNALPSIYYIDHIDGEKAYKAFRETHSQLIMNEHRYCNYERKRKSFAFDETILVVSNGCLLELNGNCCYIMHSGTQDDFITACTELFRQFKERQRRQPLEINLIVANSRGLELKALEIKKTKLDIDLFYEDDFKEVDEVIQKRLNKKEDKGIVLLHGLPGTGKTTYLRYLIGKIKKRVLFMSPGIATNITNPDFVDLLVNNPNTVIVIEDAENIIMDRRTSGSSAVSNLLNISDGLLSDFLNVQLICTFNSSLTLVDEALMRKGRLIAKYEFGKLGIEKAKRLSQHFGMGTTVTKSMTIAEIANPAEAGHTKPQVEIIGFRQHTLIEN